MQGRTDQPAQYPKKGCDAVVHHIADTVELNNGVRMPWFGLGVYKAQEGEEVEQAVRLALSLGYRSVDTAALYGNEAGVGRAVRDSGVARDEIFLTTKVWNSDQGYDATLDAFAKSRERLGVDYVDLYLIHWPVKEKYRETWRALEKLYEDGLIRAIGVSNFQIHHLQEIEHISSVVPAVNQVECHPFLSQAPLREYCHRRGVRLEAWAPLMRGAALQNPVVLDIASAHGRTPAQVVLRWSLQHEVIIIPKSVTAARIHENAGIFDFVLTADEMSRVDALNRDQRTGPDPDDFDF